MKGKKPTTYQTGNAILDKKNSSEYYSNSDNIKIDNHMMKLINCHTGLGTFFSKKTHQIDENLASYVLIRECESCDFITHTVCPLIPLDSSHVIAIPLQNIQEKIPLQERAHHCKKCKSKLKLSRDLSDIVALEVEPPTARNAPMYTIENIQKEIYLEDRIFALFGVTEFVPNLRHFVSYVQRKNNFREKYDDLNYTHKKTDVAKLEMNVFMLFYKDNELK